MRQQARSCTSCTNKFTNKISPLLTFRWPSWEQILSPAAKSSFSGNLVDILVVRFISIPASVAGADNTVRIPRSAIAFVVAQSTSALVSSKLQLPRCNQQFFSSQDAVTHRESAGPRRCSVVHNGNLCGIIEAMQVQDVIVRPPWHSVNLHDVIVRPTGSKG